MLDYFKTILSKVSFDETLFEKELKKAIGILEPNEITELKDWCYEHYGERYLSVLNFCFLQIA